MYRMMLCLLFWALGFQRCGGCYQDICCHPCQYDSLHMARMNCKALKISVGDHLVSGVEGRVCLHHHAG